MAIGFSKELNAETNRILKNFNEKRRRNKTKTKGRGMLPARVSISNFKAKYSDKPREEILKQLKLYQSFSQKDALDKGEDSRLSKWESDYFKANLDKTKKFFDDEMSDLARIIGGRPEYHLRIHSRYLNLERQRKWLDKDFTQLDDDDILTMRTIFEYAERSEIVKRQGFRHYLNQLERTMTLLGYSKEEIDTFLNKFNVLTENEFTEMTRNEDIVDSIYDLIDSPKGRGKYQLMTEEERANAIIDSLMSRADELIATYKKSD